MKQKIIYLVLLALFFKGPAISQVIHWEETFDDNPPGWNMDDHWSIAPGKLMMTWYPVITNYDQEAVSPVISLPNASGELIINQYLSIFSVVTTEQCEISILHGGNETVLWDYECVNGDWGSQGGSELPLDISAFGGQDVQFKFRSWGPTTDAWYDWNVYDLTVTVLLDEDMAVTGINGPYNVDQDVLNNWAVSVKNSGLQVQTGYKVTLFDEFTGKKIDSVMVSEPLYTGETNEIDFSWTPDTCYNTVLYATVESEYDDYPANNTHYGAFVRVEPNFEYSVLVIDKDNGIATINDPETGQAMEPNVAIERILQNSGIEFETAYDVPNNLTDYDIVLLTLGCYCLS